MITIEKALISYARILEAEDVLESEYSEKLLKMKKDKETIEKFLKNGDEIDQSNIPQIIKEKSPYLVWSISPKTYELNVSTYMRIDRVIKPKIEDKAKEEVSILKEQCSELGNWALGELLKHNTKSFPIKGIGSVQKRTDIKYSVSDKSSVVHWAVDEGVESELSISFRPNSKFMQRVVEDTGELPPGVSSFKESKAVYVKG